MRKAVETKSTRRSCFLPSRPSVLLSKFLERPLASLAHSSKRGDTSTECETRSASSDVGHVGRLVKRKQATQHKEKETRRD